MTHARPFRYLADPACLVSLLLYSLNRFVLKPHHIGSWFTHGYLNDLLCLPLFVPIVLYIQHIVGVRRHSDFPRIWEIFQIWAAFTIVFQVVVPRFPRTFGAAGDPFDILAYLAGGIAGRWFWSFSARRIARRPSADPARPRPPAIALRWGATAGCLVGVATGLIILWYAAGSFHCAFIETPTREQYGHLFSAGVVIVLALAIVAFSVRWMYDSIRGPRNSLRS